jgi:predicted 2-oxoglutarate/Fe(II)-dependent dioxygenase YbiX
LKDYEEHLRGIFVVELFDRRFCEELVGCLRDSEAWSEAMVNVRSDQGGSESVIKAETRSARARHVPPEFLRRFDEVIDRRVKPLVNGAWGSALKQHSGTHVVRYSVGDYYAEHADSAVASRHRVFSVVCYLNEGFGGGQTGFPRLGYSVEPVAGRAVIFPSNFIHRAEPVTKGKKLVIVTWLTGPPPVRWI